MYLKWKIYQTHIDGLTQDCVNSIANALELLQAWTQILYNHKWRKKSLLLFSAVSSHSMKSAKKKEKEKKRHQIFVAKLLVNCNKC